jgi:hypothetical protein
MVDRGSMRLHDAVLPALTADNYRIDISTTSSQGTFSAQRYLTIEAPRFRIEERDMIATFPMPGASGKFESLLPYVVLRRRTLPWERRGASPDRAAPWLALVVTTSSEARLVALPLAAAVGDATASKLQPAPASVAALQFNDSSTLQRIVASEADARLLCHVREVNQADNELAASDDDGWVAVVVGNRLLNGPTGTRWRATLVSLEQRDDLASNTPATAALLALASWEFTSTSVGSFQSLVTNLHRGVFGQGIGPVAMKRLDLSGATTEVYYSSPLSAAAPQPSERDVTREAASELGRMLVAADGRLLRELLQWQRESVTSASRQLSQQLVAPGPHAIPPPARAPSHVSAAVRALQRVSRASLPQARPDGSPSEKGKLR